MVTRSVRWKFRTVSRAFGTEAEKGGRWWRTSNGRMTPPAQMLGKKYATARTMIRQKYRLRCINDRKGTSVILRLRVLAVGHVVFSLPMKADYISLSFVFRLDSSE